MNKIYIIAEIGINHNGDMKLAKELIGRSAQAGADAVKFQKRTIKLVYTPEELDKYRESPWGTTNREQKEGLEFDIEQYKELQSFANNLNLDFIVSCWDMDSVDLVEQHLNVRYHKIASALATNKEFLQKLNETKKPVILSTGMCSEEQIEAAVDILGDSVEYVLACTSTYPTMADEVNLRHMVTLKNNYPHCKIGFSNHYNGHDACVGAAVLDAECIEFHVTKDRTMYGSDQSASIEREDLVRLVKETRKVTNTMGTGQKFFLQHERPVATKLRYFEVVG